MATFTDDFNRADSTNLGAGWVEVSGDWSIVSNQLSPGAAGGTIILRAAGAMATNDNFAQVTIAATTVASQGVWCRGNSNITQGYLFRNNGTSWDLFYVVGGSFTVIGTYTAAAAPGDVAKVQAVGSTIQGYVNGVQRVSVTDTHVTTGTSVGIRSDSAGAIRFDDFSAGDVTTGTTGDAALSGSAALSASGVRATAGGASQVATVGLSAAGQLGAVDAASGAVTATLTADGTRSTVGGAACAVTAPISAQGAVAATGSATASTAASLSAAGAAGFVGGASLTGSAALSAGGVLAASVGGFLAAGAGLSAAGSVASPVASGVSGPGVVASPNASGGVSSTPVVSSGLVLVPTASGGFT